MAKGHAAYRTKVELSGQSSLAPQTAQELDPDPDSPPSEASKALNSHLCACACSFRNSSFSILHLQMQNSGWTGRYLESGAHQAHLQFLKTAISLRSHAASWMARTMLVHAQAVQTGKQFRPAKFIRARKPIVLQALEQIQFHCFSMPRSKRILWLMCAGASKLFSFCPY